MIILSMYGIGSGVVGVDAKQRSEKLMTLKDVLALFRYSIILHPGDGQVAAIAVIAAAFCRNCNLWSPSKGEESIRPDGSPVLVHQALWHS